jgi:MFS family permease
VTDSGTPLGVAGKGRSLPPHPPRAVAVAAALLAFGSGFGILVLEIAGGRLLAGTYGLSTVPWTGVIATVLAGLALGNTLGGRLADRGRASLYLLYLGAAASVAVPILGDGLPGWFLARAGFLGGALLTSMAYFFIPSILMGAVTPVLVARTTERVEEVGRRFGDVGAWSTAGAILGTVAGGFVLLPAFSLGVVLASVGAAFLLFAALGAALEEVRPVGRVGLALGLMPIPFLVLLIPSPPPGLIFQGQSVHASIRVVDTEWAEGVQVRELWQNGSRSSAEVLATGEPAHRYQVATAWLLSERIEDVGSILVLGGAANSLPTHLKRWNPALDITVVEIDPRVEEVARGFFAYGRLEPGAIRMRFADARPFLRRERGTYDVILADAYDHLYSAPWPLLTREAFLEMASRLRPDGIVIVTLSTPLEGRASALLERVVATLESVFPQVRLYPSQPGRDPARTQELLAVAAMDRSSLPTLEWPGISVTPAGAPFRDDFAPVEYLTALRLLYDPAW